MEQQPDIDADLRELALLLAQTIRALKAAAPPPPPQLGADCSALSKRHMPALMVLALSGPLSVSELAAELGLGLSTTSTLVGDLSRAGILDRAEDESDRRRTIVQLHEAHRAAIAGWARAALEPLRRTLSALTPVGRAQFMDGWRLLHGEAAGSSS